MTLDNLAASLARIGYHVNLTAACQGWHCRLECGVDTLPGNLPRPCGGGATAVGAVLAAVDSFGIGTEHYSAADRRPVEAAKVNLVAAIG